MSVSPGATPHLEVLHPDSQFNSATGFFTQYRLARSQVGAIAGRTLLDELHQAAIAASRGADCVIVSAENIEVLLTFRDSDFRTLLNEASEEFEVLLLVYLRSFENFIFSSWQEFSWSTGESLSSWVRRFSKRSQPSATLDDFSADHRSELVDVSGWATHWRGQGFETRFVALDGLPAGAVGDFSTLLQGKLPQEATDQRSNAAWPPSAVRTLPHLAPVFANDYWRFAALRGALASFPFDVGTQRALNASALALIRGYLGPGRNDELRSAEDELQLPMGSLGLQFNEGDPEPSLRDLEDWEAAVPSDWLALTTALAGIVLFDRGFR